jgi:hypothetical protein
MKLLFPKGVIVNTKDKMTDSTMKSISQKREDSNGLREEGGNEVRPQVREAVSKLQFLF